MLSAEMAATHGYANVMVKGHAKQRARDWRKIEQRGRPAKNTGTVNVAGWRELQAKFGEMGYPVQVGGPTAVQ